MKYRGKYSLKENLFRGRGMGLLKENYRTIKVDGGFKSGPSGQKVYATEEEAKAAFQKGQDRGGIGATSQATAKGYLEANYSFGSVSAGGRGNADDLTIDGVKVEVGRGTSKYSELGVWNDAAGNWDAGKTQTAAKQKLTAPIVKALGGSSALGKGRGQTAKDPQLTAAQVEKFWKATTDDCIMLDNGGEYTIFALNATGQGLDFNGENPPLLTASACFAGHIQRGGTRGSDGASRYGVQFSSIDWSKGLRI